MRSSVWSASHRCSTPSAARPPSRLPPGSASLFGGVSTALSSFWLMFFQGFSVWTYGGTILGYMGYNALLFPFLLGLSRIGPRFRPFLLAIGWTVYEYFKSIGFLGIPVGPRRLPRGKCPAADPVRRHHRCLGPVLPHVAGERLVAEYALAGWRPLFRRQGAFVVFLVAARMGLWPHEAGHADPGDFLGRARPGPAEHRSVGRGQRQGGREQPRREREPDRGSREGPAEEAGSGRVE